MQGQEGGGYYKVSYPLDHNNYFGYRWAEKGARERGRKIESKRKYST